MVELSQTPVDEAQLLLLVIDHDVVGFDVAVHDALRVTELERYEQLLHVKATVCVGEGGVQRLKVLRVDVVEDERGGAAVGVADDVKKGNNVGAADEVLQDLDFPFDFALLDRLQHFDDAKLCVAGIVSFENLAVLATAHFFNHFVVFLRAPAYLPKLSKQ